MKYLAMLFLMLGGCATNSEYWQGCVDTTNTLENSPLDKTTVAHFCDALDTQHRHPDLGRK
jgi:hypothetical protein